MHALLLGRTRVAVDEVQDALGDMDVTFSAGTSLGDARDALHEQNVDVVIMDAGIALETRVKIAHYVFTVSDSTSVHMKDRASGPAGMLSFARRVLAGLAE